MSLLDDLLPRPIISPDCDPHEFLDRLAVIASELGYACQRNRDYAGLGGNEYDLINIEVVIDAERLTARLSTKPTLYGRIDLDVVTRWSERPIRYMKYVAALRRAYAPLFRAYRVRHGKQLKLRTGIGPPRVGQGGLRSRSIALYPRRVRDGDSRTSRW